MYTRFLLLFTYLLICSLALSKSITITETNLDLKSHNSKDFEIESNKNSGFFCDFMKKLFRKILLQCYGIPEEIQTEKNVSSIEQNAKRRMMRCRRRLIGTSLSKKAILNCGNPKKK